MSSTDQILESQIIIYSRMSREEDSPHKARCNQALKTATFFAKRPTNTLHGSSWDAKHLTTFLSQSHYSNWHCKQKNISQLSLHKSKHNSMQIDGLKEEIEDKNCSKIGFTSIFPLVTNTPIKETRQLALQSLLQWHPIPQRNGRIINGHPLSLRCRPQSNFRFQGNAIKFKHTDPLTIRNQLCASSIINGHQKERISRLIKCRYPHGMMGIDHPQNSGSLYYEKPEEKLKIRQQPNNHSTFVLDRDWKQKKRCNRPSDELTNRRTIAIRKFRNSNTHEYNILTNRKFD